MAPRTVFMFSGQGSHSFQMGLPLFERHAVFRGHMLQLDERVRELCGLSVLEAVYGRHDRTDPFDRTLLTHPAIFMVEYSLARALMGEGVLPDLVLGTSLGAFAAAVLAGCISVEDALRAIVCQALAFEESCEKGGMIAILASPSLYEKPFLSGDSELAAINFSSHFVVAARNEACGRIVDRLQATRVSYQRLPVSHAFHSRWIDGGRQRFTTFMQSIRLQRAALPIVCCSRAAMLQDLTPGHFWEVVRNPIRFQQAVAQLHAEELRFIDVGPQGTLATFLKYTPATSSRRSIHTIMSPFATDLQNWRLLTGRDL